MQELPGGLKAWIHQYESKSYIFVTDTKRKEHLKQPAPQQQLFREQHSGDHYAIVCVTEQTALQKIQLHVLLLRVSIMVRNPSLWSW